MTKGIAGTALQGFKSYRSGRPFRVSWRDEMSNPQHLTTGVPQGLVLRPILFFIYMSSVESVIQKHGFSYHCFGDHFIPAWMIQTVAAHISTCLTDISCWMKGHNPKLNFSTTKLLVVSANPTLHHNFSFQLGTSTITSLDNLKPWSCNW